MIDSEMPNVEYRMLKFPDRPLDSSFVICKRFATMKRAFLSVRDYLFLLIIMLLWSTGISAQDKGSQLRLVGPEVSARVMDSVVSIESINLVYEGLTMNVLQRSVVPVVVTGIVMSPDGFILTNGEAIKSAKKIRVHLNDGRELVGTKIVVDQNYDIGLVKVDAKGLKPVKWGNSLTVKQGDSAIAVGASGSYKGTLTLGIISAIRDFRNNRYILIPDMIQTDASVNYGNEGCPLFNYRAEVIGLNSLISVTGRGPLQNTSFFIPSNVVRKIADELVRTKEPAFRPWLGLKPYIPGMLMGRPGEIGDDLKMMLGLPDQYWDIGVLVEEVKGGSPADVAGFRKGDLIVKIDGHLMKSINQIERKIFNYKKNQKVIIGLVRNALYKERELYVDVHPKEIMPFYF